LFCRGLYRLSSLFEVDFFVLFAKYVSCKHAVQTDKGGHPTKPKKSSAEIKIISRAPHFSPYQVNSLLVI